MGEDERFEQIKACLQETGIDVYERVYPVTELPTVDVTYVDDVDSAYPNVYVGDIKGSFTCGAPADALYWWFRKYGVMCQYAWYHICRGTDRRRIKRYKRRIRRCEIRYRIAKARGQL